MHDENLVHRNLKAENVLIFDKEFNKVKLTDFGLTRKIETTIKYGEAVTPYHAPELCEILQNESITLRCSLDIWSLGIIFYYCLKSKFPWQKASILNKSYWEWEQYLKRKIPALPKRWEFFSEKSMKILKKCLNPKPKDRWTAKDMRKCFEKVGSLKNQKVKLILIFFYCDEIFRNHRKNMYIILQKILLRIPNQVSRNTQKRKVRFISGLTVLSPRWQKSANKLCLPEMIEITGSKSNNLYSEFLSNKIFTYFYSKFFTGPFC